MSDHDLPLLSNISDIRARHYLIQLEPNFHTKVIQGKVFIFFEPTTSCEKRGKCCTRDCLCSDSGTNYFRKSTEHVKDSDGQCSINEPVSRMKEMMDKDFEVILDCCDIKMSSVTEVICEGIDLQQYLHPYCPRVCRTAIDFWCSRNQVPLQYTVSSWCIRIWKEGIKNLREFPQVVCITYETTPQGKSLLWRNDVDGNPCLFTPAAVINNRSLLPCQDPPTAMATWQAWITVSKEYTVSMTGDSRPVTYVSSVEDIMNNTATQKHMDKDFCFIGMEEDALCSGDNTNKEVSKFCHYYYTTMVLPIATIAIAIGKWKIKVLPTVNSKDLSERIEKGEQIKAIKIKYTCCHYEYPCHMKPELWNYETPLTLVYPPSCGASIKPLSSFLPYALKAAIRLLGIYPCRRLEVVILPPCFGSLGLASPNLIFLSPSIVLDDPSTYIRLAHEISHAWFGIVIGAQDWTEEWLSEGFATYMEDSIYGEAALAYQKDKYTFSEHTSYGSSHQEWERADDKKGCKGKVRAYSKCGKSSLSGVADKGPVDTRGCGELNHGQGIQRFEYVNTRYDSKTSGLHDKYANAIDEECFTCCKHTEYTEDGVKLLKEGPSEVGKFLHKNLVWYETYNSQVLEEEKDFLITSCKAVNKEMLSNLSSLRAHIRYRTLASELENSTEELQTLRPMQGKDLVGADGVTYVKNGLNVEKAFLQVHYLKGYFLLKFLSKLVGSTEFNAMIKEFVSIYHGQLILSKHVLDHFTNTFPHVIDKDFTQERLYRIWLHQPGLNDEIKEMYENISSDLVSEVRQHYLFWEQINKSKKKPGQAAKKVKVELNAFIFPDELVLLLEYLLQLPKLSKNTLSQIYEHYNMKDQCGDVRHRWCELVIKNNYDDLDEVERFLVKDQSMGVYLFGELIISRKIKHRQLAKKVFSKIRKNMDENSQLTVFNMIYGE
ncbi:aminopeptidase O-like [Panulirus ornatus]|uniref:aminopeptidase O-like n=1 Tax=Panulirus ornatus TaxID=150431 RepID=UPI003A891C67